MGGENSAESPQITYKAEIRIAVRGARKTGKSTFLEQIQNANRFVFKSDYFPTQNRKTIICPWNSRQKIGDTYKFIITELVDEDQLNENPDSLTNYDGIVVFYNPALKNTVEYAFESIESTPSSIPILLISNFLDLRSNRNKSHPILQPLSKKFLEVQTSFVTGDGLDIIAQWLDFPILYHAKTMYKKWYHQTADDLVSKKKEIQNFIIESEKGIQKPQVPIITPVVNAEVETNVTLTPDENRPNISNLLSSEEDQNDTEEPLQDDINDENTHLEENKDIKMEKEEENDNQLEEEEDLNIHE